MRGERQLNEPRLAARDKRGQRAAKKPFRFAGNYDWENGRVSGCVYRNAESELKQLVKEVYGAASLTNPLHPDVFPGVCKMEAEVVRIACRLFGGDDNTCGTVSLPLFSRPATLPRGVLFFIPSRPHLCASRGLRCSRREDCFDCQFFREAQLPRRFQLALQLALNLTFL